MRDDRSMKVLGIGDVGMDNFISIDHIPAHDEKVTANSFLQYPGGMIANFLISLNRLGTPCVFNGLVGDDSLGEVVLRHLRQEGVDTSYAIIKNDSQTYFCVVLLDGSGEKSLIVVPSSTNFPQPQDISKNAIEKVQLVHTTAGIYETVREAFDYAKTHQKLTSIDFEVNNVKDTVRWMPILRKVDILFMNVSSAEQIWGDSYLINMKTDLRENANQVVTITRGKAGSISLAAGKVVAIDGFDLCARDTTGAGDCFAAGFIHGYLNRWAIADIALFANAVAAISISEIGGSKGAPTYDETIIYLSDSGISFVPHIKSIRTNE